MWFIQALEILKDGKPSGRFRMTATSDEGGGGPYGNLLCDHASKEEAETCDKCDEYCSRVAGFPSKKKMAELTEQLERKELERLKKKYE